MKEFRRDIVHRTDVDYYFVEVGIPDRDAPQWHQDLYNNQSYPFPTLAAARLFASNHARIWPGRDIQIKHKGEIID